MCCTDSNDIGYHNYITCSYDQLCRHTILYFTGWSAGCNTDRDSRWNILIHCRINDRCGDRCHHTEHKHSRNLYGYLYDGSSRWMCRTDSDYIGHYNYITCSYDQLCRHTILFFTGRSAVCNTDRHSRWNIFIHCRINDQCSHRCDHTKYKYSRNLYGYLYDGRCRRMCCTRQQRLRLR